MYAIRSYYATLTVAVPATLTGTIYLQAAQFGPGAVGPPVVCLVHGTRVVKSTGSYIPVETLKVGDLVMGLSDQHALPDYTVITKVVTDHPREAS